MKISFSTIPGNLIRTIGYGYAGYNMVCALQRLGHQVPFQDPSAKVQIHFSQPEYFDFHPGQYKIGYTPWESTGMPEGWVDTFNTVDELWTPSPLIAQWYEDAGVKTGIKVYEHGVDKIWSPRRRRPERKIRFLHMGEPAPRKGGEMAFRAFRDAFGSRDDVHLTIKSNGASTVRYKDKSGSIIALPTDFNNVSVITQVLDEPLLVNLFHEHDAFVYPGWGEGFGLIPIQAMATGMPTICTEAWAPYARFILPELRLGSQLVDSPWPFMHPGQMFKPSYDELVDMYRYTADNFNRLAGNAYRESFNIHQDYDWDRLTEDAFAHIVKKFS